VLWAALGTAVGATAASNMGTKSGGDDDA
jgi:hypothetical protein